MSTFNSGLLVMSAVASSSGLQSISESVLNLRTKRRQLRRDKRRGYVHTPLDAREKKELLNTIVHDDWFE